MAEPKKMTASALFGMLVNELAQWYHREEKKKLLDLYNKIWGADDLTADEVDWDN